jgi:glycosyltransferase involved in cell wall biosynthesis
MTPASPGTGPREQLEEGLVELVVIPRERYSGTLAQLGRLLATLPAHVKVTLVRGGMPDRLARNVVALDGGRVRVVGPARHLAPNAARSIGLRTASARYVVFIDNDVDPSPGWLEALVQAAIEEDAWVVRPIVLQRIGDTVTVHESGGDCHLEQYNGVTTLVESHRHLGGRPEDLSDLHREEVELFEFHTVLFDRARLLAIGGPDEQMRSLADHLDLALRVRSAGGSVWLEPASRTTYVVPQRLPLRDLPFFLGRWSPTWTDLSRKAFYEKHGVNDPEDPYYTWRYADLHRSYAWLPIGRAASFVLRRPVTHRVASRFDQLVGARIAACAQRLAPRWRGAGLESSP